MDDIELKVENGSFENNEAEYKGQLVEYTKEKDGTFKLARVISTDPQVYLKKDFQPGVILNNPQFFMPSQSDNKKQEKF